MEKTKKITKRDVLTAIKALAMTDVDFGTEVTAEDVIAYCDTTLTQLDSKNEKAKERAAKKKEESDALTDVIQAIISDEPQTIAQVLEQIDSETEVTPAMVSARTAKLVKAGVVERVKVRVDKRDLVAYKKA